jgi:hypothetical protein
MGTMPEFTMLIEKFDAYGEVLPDAAGASPKRQRLRRRCSVGSGQYAFWLLVVIIVSMRIVYYPAPAFEVGAATDVKHAATR